MRSLRRRAAWLLLLLLAATTWAQQEADTRSVEVLNPVIEAEPREVVNLRLRLSNRSDVSPWMVEPQVALARGWNLLAPPGAIVLPPGETINLVLPILVPASAAAGTYTFPVNYHLPGRERQSELLFTVEVRQVDRIEVAVLDRPEMLVAGDYRVRYLVSNRGNRRLTLRSAPTSSHGYRVGARPASLALGPGEAAEVVVEVEVPADLGVRQSHTVTLVAAAVDDPELRGEARARSDVIPSRIPPGSIFHTFPFTVRAAASLGSGAPTSALAGTGTRVEVSGRGQPTPTDSGQLGVRVALSLEEGIDELLLDYRRPEFAISVGSQTFVTSPLIAGESGFGIAAEGQWEVADELQLAVQANLYVTGGDAGSEAEGSGAPTAAVRMMATHDQETEFGVGLRARPGEAVATAQAGYTPRTADPALLQLAHVGGAYGLRFAVDEERPGHALDFTVRYREGPSLVTLALQGRSAQFSGDRRHRLSFTASGALRMNEALGVGQEFPVNLQLSYVSDWRWDGREPLTFGGLDDAARSERFEASLGAAVGSARMAVGYRIGLGDGGSPGERQEALSARLNVDLGSSVTVSQETRWLWTVGGEAFQRGALEYRGDVNVRTAGAGKLTGRFRVRMKPGLHEAEELSFGVSWAGKPAAALNLRAEAQLEPFASNVVASLSLAGGYRLPNDHSLAFELLARALRDADPTLAIGLAYSFPVAVPIGRLPNLGEVYGSVLYADGRPAPGLVVTIGDLATTTQADGSFRFPGVPHGSQTLRLLASDRLAATQLVTPASTVSIEVVEGERVNADFTIIEGAAVHGQIVLVPASDTDTDALRPEVGDPAVLVAGASVELRAEHRVVRAVSDSSGAFTFRHLPPGEWTLSVRHPNLPRDHRIEPSEQTLRLGPGEIEEVQMEIVPVIRRVRFMEGGELPPPDSN